jgi:hypothetical protein
MENDIIVTTAFDHFAFGIVKDSGEQVYIPSNIVQKFDIHELDTMRAIISPNRSERAGSVPWFTVYVTQHNGVDTAQNDEQEPKKDIATPMPVEPEEQPQEPVISRCRVILELLKDGGVYSTAQVANHVSEVVGTDISSSNIQPYLFTLHRHGKVAVAEISQSQFGKVGRRYWAKKSSDIFVLLNGEKNEA